jgi:hypothetical protein
MSGRHTGSFSFLDNIESFLDNLFGIKQDTYTNTYTQNNLTSNKNTDYNSQINTLSKQYQELNTQNNKLSNDLHEERIKNEIERINLEQGYKKQVNIQEKKMQNIQAKNEIEKIKLKQEIEKEISSLKKHYNSKIKIIDENTNKLKKETSENFKKINFELTKIKEKENQKSQHAKNEFAYLNYMLEELKTLKIEYFLPEKYNNLIDKIEQAHNNIKKEIYEASIAISQTTILEELKLKDDLEIINLKSNLLKKLTIKNLHIFEKLIDDKDLFNVKKEYNTSDGAKIVEEIDVKYWAEDSFRKTLNEYNSLKKEFKEFENISLEERENLTTKSNILIENFKETIKEAIKRFDSHIVAQESQEEISIKLENLGFELIDNIYQNEDEREANIALYENSLGIKIKILIDPKKNIVETSFNSLNDYLHNEQKKVIEDIVGCKLEDENGFESTPAPESDFDLNRYLIKNENS